MAGFVSFLKKAGTLLVNTVSVVELGYPILGRLLPAKAQPVADTIISDLEQFSSVVTNVEAVGQALPTALTGEQKFKAALPLITRAVAASSVMAGKKIADNTLFQKACNEYAQATVDMLNSLDGSTISAKPATQ
jgi:hypothetical protein